MNKALATKNVAAVLLGVALVVTFAFAFAAPEKPAIKSTTSSTSSTSTSTPSKSLLVSEFLQNCRSKGGLAEQERKNSDGSETWICVASTSIELPKDLPEGDYNLKVKFSR